MYMYVSIDIELVKLYMYMKILRSFISTKWAKVNSINL